MSQVSQEANYAPTDTSLLGVEHVRLYRETNGEQGHIWNGVPILLLTTKGRVSGEPRTIPIIFNRDGDNYFIIASCGGSPKHPQWYLNLSAEPRVQLQVKADKFDAVARTVESPERERLWAVAMKTWPKYDLYQTRTTRRIPVVVIEPARGSLILSSE